MTVRVVKFSSSTTACMNSSVTRTELLAFWKKMRAVGFGVGAGAVVAGLHEVPGLGFFLHLALDEVFDVGVVDVEDDHLGGAAGFAAGLDDAGEGVEAAHEAERAGGGAAAGEGFHGAADGGEVGACARAPLEEHAFGLGEGEDASRGSRRRS